MAAGEFRVLGTLEVGAPDGRALPLGGPKPRALLAALLVRANEPVGVDRLVEALWGSTPPETARHSVEVYVSALRKALGRGAIAREGSAYRLCVDQGKIDANRFESLLHRGEEQLLHGRAERAAETLRDAIGLWRGPAFADLAYHDFARVEAERLEELRLTAIETRLEAELVLGRQDGTVAELQALVAEHPLRERFRAQLMLALYRRGRQSEALGLYRETRSALVEELGLEPGEELRELERMILAHDPALQASGRTGVAFLPAEVTTFVGREHQLNELCELLEDEHTRLVTLTGPGGIGKTRLAVATASVLAPAYSEGVWFVDLSSLRDSSLLASAIGQAVGAEGEPAEHVRDRRALFVLDNFEQLLEAAGEVSELLARCPNLNVLVTSRERLRLRGEHVYEVPPLSEPAATELFVDRARSVVRAFEPDETTAVICGRLDGLPLAIELAAARIPDLGQECLSAQLQRRLAALVDGPVDLPGRQASLRATIEWSHDLLDADEQRLFARLGIFAGGWTREAAAEIAGASLEALGSLAAKSLVEADGGRFSMLETIRELAAEQLAARGEEAELATRHADWFVSLGEQAGREMNGPAQRAWFDRLEAELGNVRAALGRLLEQGDYERAGRMTGGMMRFWSGRGHHVEGDRWMRRILEHEDALTPRTRAVLQEIAGVLEFLQGDGSTPLSLVERAHDTFVELGDHRSAARCLDHVAAGYLQSGDVETALEVGERALLELVSIGDDWGTANCLGHLGLVLIYLGRFDQAAETLGRCLELLETVRDPEIEEYAQLGIGTALLKLGRLDEANQRLIDCVRIGRDLGDKAGVVNALEALAAVAAEELDATRAERLLAVAASIREELGFPIHPLDLKQLDPHFAKVDMKLGEVRPSAPGRIRLAEAVELAVGAVLSP